MVQDFSKVVGVGLCHGDFSWLNLLIVQHFFQYNTYTVVSQTSVIVYFIFKSWVKSLFSVNCKTEQIFF